ncbi:hemerythrin domain-containing protein [Actinomadura mexicana]|uniref:Hemerythrin HHE cation binding domain-containing protein n=1 Tax=Actinomadura mexicana TaxID=134959 RepID=A0A238UWR9_9ACTN|nr:hemerythrin domain-containing protein [Actinomadura mexicana]SNR26672.1 Hemerythrin HHE cation binding domain-containing protein [Actinomadura mexicana]
MSEYDWTLMYVMHDALRRELEHLAKVTAREDDDPRRLLAAAAGWELFKLSLHAHHTAEDEALWPAVREALDGRADDLALLDAMEAEHAAVDPLVEAIDTGAEPVGELVDALATALTAHLAHEEKEALPLIDATLTPEQFQSFGQAHGRHVGPHAPRVLPWLLDGVDDATTAATLSVLPEPARTAFETQWQPAYQALERWPAS